MKKLIIIFVIAICPLLALKEVEKTIDGKQEQKVEKNYPYVSIGIGPLPFPCPIFTIGYCGQSDHYGYDVNLAVATIFEITALKQNILYRYYPNPNYASQIYFGAGLGVTEIYVKNFLGDSNALFCFLSPEFVVGKQFQTKNKKEKFLQLQIGFPYFDLDDEFVSLFPIFAISYGISF